MAQPVWVTPAGSLGIIPEGVFYSTPLEAYEPESMGPLYYQLIAGTLPAGMQINQNGILVGIPEAVITVQGVPEQVNRDVTSKFAVRAYTLRTINGVQVVDRLADRTFELTVTGADIPEFVTPPGQIAQFYDGTLVNDLQIEYSDPDPNADVRVRLISGSLPPGLTISRTGVISGLIQPLAATNAIQGFSRDGQGYDVYGFDFGTRNVNANYEFTLELSDNQAEGTNLRTFSIYVWSRSIMTADTTQITADNTFVTADNYPAYIPVLLNPQGSIGRVRNDNWFAYKFDAIDFDGSQTKFIITASSPEPLSNIGLTLDINSGWLYGYIPDLGIQENTYNFSLKVYKAENPTFISNAYNYSLSVTGPIDTEIFWLTDSNLGTIDNGATSTLFVEAVNPDGIVIEYELLNGSNSSLPQGLRLLPSGNIAGRVSFDTFALDGGLTTFDVTKENGQDPTTFDMTYTFTVRAFSNDGLIDINKTFTITVVRRFNEPYENLYIQCMPPEDDRVLVNSLLNDTDIFQPDLIYRSDDPNFGVANKIVYNHAFGLTAATIEDYYSSLYENHYWKNLVLGEISTAQALDANGNVVYEVIYSRVVDNLLNSQGESVSKEVLLPFSIDYADDFVNVTKVYPNSLINMRDQVIDVVGQVSNILPLWMISKQKDGKILGFTPAWVLAYTKPGQADRIAYYLNTQFGEKLNLVDFEVDRYELDRLLTKNWDPETKSWIPSPPLDTTFDINNHYESVIFTAGLGYAVGDQIRILGSQIGGVNGIYNPAIGLFGNDIIITVTQVSNLGAIQQIFYSGTAPLLSTGDFFNNVVGTNLSGSGTGATWYVEVVPGVETVFDGNSLQFITPVDMYSNTQEYDKYLVFPKRNILE